MKLVSLLLVRTLFYIGPLHAQTNKSQIVTRNMGDSGEGKTPFRVLHNFTEPQNKGKEFQCYIKWDVVFTSTTISYGSQNNYQSILI